MENTVKLFEREILALINELTLFNNEELIWKTTPGISNSAGNLSLHIIGNLNHFIGTTLGNTDYIRNRDAEFSSKNIPLDKMIFDLKNTIELIKTVIPKLDSKTLKSDFPLLINNTSYRTDFFIQHLLSHLSYHLGQVNYLRRIISIEL